MGCSTSLIRSIACSGCRGCGVCHIKLIETGATARKKNNPYHSTTITLLTLEPALLWDSSETLQQWRCHQDARFPCDMAHRDGSCKCRSRSAMESLSEDISDRPPLLRSVYLALSPHRSGSQLFLDRSAIERRKPLWSQNPPIPQAISYGYTSLSDLRQFESSACRMSTESTCAKLISS